MNEAVVLVHGLWMRGPDMSVLRRRLRRCGFNPYQFSYLTRRTTVREAAQQLQRYASTLPETTVHFVAHSLGGLVVYRMAHEFPSAHPGRIVTLGSPHHGSAIARRLARHRLGRALLGKSVVGGLVDDEMQWTAPNELGVIAGNFPVGGGSLIGGLRGPNDGTVAVEETRLPGMKQHCVMRVSHMGLLFSSRVARLTCHFLRAGKF